MVLTDLPTERPVVTSRSPVMQLHGRSRGPLPGGQRHKASSAWTSESNPPPSRAPGPVKEPEGHWAVTPDLR